MGGGHFTGKVSVTSKLHIAILTSSQHVTETGHVHKQRGSMPHLGMGQGRGAGKA